MPDLTRRDGVELARVGEWSTSTGTWRAAPGDFAAAIAATACPAVDKPYLRLGHSDPRFPLLAEPPKGDGEPALGWIENLRVSDRGHTLVGDWVEIPEWLNGVAASAYPRRSVEGVYNRRCSLGHTHPFVLDGLALLGITRPGVGTLKPIGGLDDVKSLFTPLPVAASSDEVRIAASIPDSAVEAAAREGDAERLKIFWSTGRGGVQIIKWQPQEGSFKRCVRAINEHVPEMTDPEGYCATLYRRVHGEWPGQRNRKGGKVAASDTGGAMPNPQPSYADIVREAWNATSPPYSQHVHAVRAGTAIVLDESDRSFWRVPVTVDGDVVSFGERERVMPDFVDYDETLVAASTTFATREESRPSATVLDIPEPVDAPPDPRPPAEPAVPAGPPDETPEPVTPPDEGGVSDSPTTPDAESEQQVHTEPKEGPVPDMSELRSRLGLADDADVAAIVAAVDALKSKADIPPEPSPDQVAASAAAEQEKTELRKEVSVLASQVETMSTKLAAAEAEKAATVKASVLDKAQELGKFPPAERPQWESDYDAAPGAITRTLDRIAPGTAVPVTASGYTGTGDEATGEAFDADYDKHFRTATKAGAN